MSTGRPTHPKPDLEKLLKLVEANGWRVTRGKKYYSCRCACLAHMKTMHLTPSDPNYALNMIKWFQRQPCWKGEKP